MVDRKKRIVLIVPSLKAGGAERIMAFLSYRLVNESYSVHLLVVGFAQDSRYDFDPERSTFLNKKKVSQGFWGILAFLKQYRPDIVMSSVDHLNALVGIIALIYPKPIYIGRETFVRGFDKSKRKNTISNFSYKILSAVQKSSLSFIVCQSRDMFKDLLENYNYPEKKLIVINNPISGKFKNPPRRVSSDKDKIFFVSVGRLVKNKGHQRIIKGLAKITYDFHFTLIGSGPEEESLKKLIIELNLQSNFTHIPYTSEVEQILVQNDYYLHGSFVEGFPNAILESCSVGTPAIVFEAPGGINELIIPGLNGYIAKDIDEFIELLSNLRKDTFSPSEVIESVTKRYSEEKIIRDYLNLFENALTRYGK